MLGFGPLATFALATTPGGSGVPAGQITFHGSNVVPNQHQVTSGHLLFGGATPVLILAPSQLTWMGLEVAHPGQPNPRVSWIAIEVLRSPLTQPTRTNVTWAGLEAAHDGHAFDRVSWMGVEVLRTPGIADSGFVSLIAG